MKHDIHDPKVPGIVRELIDEAEEAIKGDNAGARRKAWAAKKLQSVLKLPAFLPAPLQRAILSLAVEVVFQLVRKGAEAVGDAVEKGAEKRAEKKAEKEAGKPADKKPTRGRRSNPDK